MASVVQPVPYSGFMRAPLVSASTDISKRTRVRIATNQPVTYSHNNQSAYPYRAIWDISDAENFLDTRSLEISFAFTPLFYKDQQKTMYYQAGASPVIDQDTQSLIFRLSIGNAQGVIIEDFLNYNLYTNMVNAYAENPNHKQFSARHYGTLAYRVSAVGDMERLEGGDDPQACFNPSMYLTEPISSIAADGSYYPGTQTAAGQTQTGQVDATYQTAREVLIQLSNSSFFNRTRYLPLFVMRNGLRITIEFENPVLCFYNQFQGSQGLGGPGFQYVPMVQADFAATAYTGVTYAGAGGNSLLTAFPFLSVSSQGWGKLNLKTGDRIAMVFGFNNSIASSEQYITGFATINQVDAPGANASSTSLVGFEGEVQAQDLTLSVDILQLGVTAAAGAGKTLTAAKLFAGVDGTLFDFAAQSIGGISSPAIGLLGLIVEKTHSPYIFPGSFTFANPNNSYATINTRNTKFQTSITPVPGYKLGLVSGSLNYYQPSWSYTISNLELLCDYVKPSAAIFQQYVQQFSDPAGIAYPYTRVLYHSYLSTSGSANTLNIQIPFQVRSLRGIMIAITDKAAVQTTNDATIYNYPAKSSFMTRGLQNAQLFVGAQQYPARRFDFTQGVYTVAQLNELESMLGVLGNPQYTPQFTPSKLKKTSRDYAKYGAWDQASSWTSGQLLTGYRDTSRFVLAFNTQKIDGDFASGVDTSQSVSIILNMIFGQHASQRDRLIHIFGICDAVVTFQNDATLVRY